MVTCLNYSHIVNDQYRVQFWAKVLLIPKNNWFITTSD